MGRKLIISGLVMGSVLITISLLAIFYQNKLVNSIVTKSVQLIPGTELFKDWLNPPFDIFMEFYLYDLKNPEDFINGARPVFEEVGPFIYKEYRIKEDMVDNLNYTMTYNDRRYYIFAPELSPHEESEQITTLNMAATVINYIQHSRNIEHTIVNAAFEATGETLVIKKTAGEILWGYKDNFLAALHTVVPTLIPSDIVGLMYGQNDTIAGEYTLYTGVDDISKMGIIERFNHQTSVSNWPTKYANMINGTDGSVSPPFVDKNARQYAFQSNLCRSIYGVFNGTTSIRDDIELQIFAGDEYVFANATINPENADFCTPLGNCLGAGFFNMTNCLKMGNIGLPILLSCPHFLFSDEKYIKAVDGISPPNLDQHNTLAYLEPLTGIMMKVHNRIQFNANCINDSRISIAKNVPNVFFPLMWLDENYMADNKTIDKFYNQLKVPVLIMNVTKYALLIIGIVLIMSIIIHSVVKYRKNQQNSANNVNSNYNNANGNENAQQDSSSNWISNETTPLLLN